MLLLVKRLRSLFMIVLVGVCSTESIYGTQEIKLVILIAAVVPHARCDEVYASRKKIGRPSAANRQSPGDADASYSRALPGRVVAGLQWLVAARRAAGLAAAAA